jgi:pimeloyl-ACP methyl ester carboxylesterase
LAKKEIHIVFIINCLILTQAFAFQRAEQFHEVSFATADSGIVFANMYGEGDHAVVLAHGAIFNKESWDTLARLLSSRGLKVLAIDFRGYGKSKAGSKSRALYEDILAAIRYLHREGSKRVSVIGGSMGGGATAQAAVEASEREIDRLIFLSPAPIQNPDLIKGNKLFIASEDERLVSRIKKQYKNAPEPKKLVLLKGSAHAQHIFKTDQSEQLTKLILEFLDLWKDADPGITEVEGVRKRLRLQRDGLSIHHQ